MTLLHSRLSDAAVGKPIAPPVKRPFTPIATVICACCEATELTRPDHLPDGWALEPVGETEYAFCPGCAVDLPQGGAQ
ncbi:hypothetical protein FHW96_002369 [Novosphingobium sp. SG751A]|uniref:hypothetical protein n=1 Tax=Novosphingobium sp. SG751A TaxID=2587000 RepID=UPI0015531A13|nr:hypothetical protein [Novosphingobium sp. SG751A]NOW46211.1 hypothetical protein [Novosphingobium sp. SG751A]